MVRPDCLSTSVGPGTVNALVLQLNRSRPNNSRALKCMVVIAVFRGGGAAVGLSPSLQSLYTSVVKVKSAVNRILGRKRLPTRSRYSDEGNGACGDDSHRLSPSTSGTSDIRTPGIGGGVLAP